MIPYSVLLYSLSIRSYIILLLILSIIYISNSFIFKVILSIIGISILSIPTYLLYTLQVYPYYQHLKYYQTQTLQQYKQALYQRLSITTSFQASTTYISQISKLIIKVLCILALQNLDNSPIYIICSLLSYITLVIIIPTLVASIIF